MARLTGSGSSRARAAWGSEWLGRSHPPARGDRPARGPGPEGEASGPRRRHSPGPLQSAHTSLLRSRFDMVPASPAGNPATTEAAAALPL